MDIKLLQTFKKINTDSAMRIHDTAKGLVPAASTLGTTYSSHSLRPDNRRAGNVAELLAEKYVN